MHHPGQSEAYRTEVLGRLLETDTPPGISWLQFADVELADYPHYAVPVTVPVPTDSLRAAGVNVDGHDEQVIYVWTDIDVAARNRGDLDPVNFRQLPPAIEL